MRLVRRHLTFVNVMSCVALFLALGGTAAATGLITGKDVKNGSLTSADVRDHSLLRGDFRRGQLPRGPRGPAGPKGDTGTVDTSSFYDKATSDARFLRATVSVQRKSELIAVPPFSTHRFELNCPADGVALRGTYSAPGDWAPSDVEPSYTHSAYVLTISNTTSSTMNGSAQAALTCAATPAPSLTP